MRDGNCSELMIDEGEIARLLSVSNRRNQEQAPPEFHNISCQPQRGNLHQTVGRKSALELLMVK